MLKNIILLSLFSVITFANGKFTTIDHKIMNLGLNFEFDKADELLAEQMTESSSLKNDFIFLNVELLKVIKATDDASFKDRWAIKDSLNGKLIEYAEKVVEKYEDAELNIHDRFYLGSVYGVLGRLYGVSREMMSAFSAGKDGRNFMEDIVEEDPSFIDAYLLLGMMNYYADRLGGFIEFVAGILGLSGDRDVGLEYLKKVEENGVINNWQATMMLIELHSRLEGNKFESLPLLEKMVSQFPNNTHFKNWLGYDYLTMYKFDKLGKLIEDDVENELNDYIKAAYYHQIADYKKSNEFYEVLLSGEQNVWPSVYENAKFLQTLNYYYQEEFSKADELSKNINEEFKKRFDLIKNNDELNDKILNFKLAVFLNNENEINNILNSNIEFQNQEAFEAAFYYYQAIHYFKEGDLNRAEDLFIKAKNISFDDFGYITSRYLINIYLNVNADSEKVENLLDDIDELDNEGLEFFAQDLERKYDL